MIISAERRSLSVLSLWCNMYYSSAAAEQSREGANNTQRGRREHNIIVSDDYDYDHEISSI